MSRTARLRLSCGAVAIALVALAGPANAVVCVIGPAGDLPPQCFGGGGYLSPNDVHEIIDGLPPGVTIELGAEHLDFFNIVRGPIAPPPGSELEQFNSILKLDMTVKNGGVPVMTLGTKTIQTQDQTLVEPDTNPRPGVRDHDTRFLGLQGQIVNPGSGDPDFDLLRVTAGDSFGMPSPGHTTLTRLPGGNWNVDSFFDITYRIDFVGRPGGPFGGMSGSTTGTIRMSIGESLVPEPATFTLFALGLLGMFGFATRQR